MKGTFWKNAPVVETSAATGQGIEDLQEMLHALVRQTREKSARVPFRLPIDRVFSVDGFGTVVTGTLIEGALHVGGEAELLPLRHAQPRAQFAGPRGKYGDRRRRSARGGESGGH